MTVVLIILLNSGFRLLATYSMPYALFPMLLAAEFPLTLQPPVCYVPKLTLVPVSKRLADAPESFMALVVEFQG